MADVSPTGTPVVPPSAVPVLALVLLAVNGGLVALAAAAPSPTLKLVCQVLVATLAPMVGILSPGLRRADGGTQ